MNFSPRFALLLFPLLVAACAAPMASRAPIAPVTVGILAINDFDYNIDQLFASGFESGLGAGHRCLPHRWQGLLIYDTFHRFSRNCLIQMQHSARTTRRACSWRHLR